METITVITVSFNSHHLNETQIIVRKLEKESEKLWKF